MAQLTRKDLDAILEKRRPWTCVETGAFQGHFTAIALEYFTEVISVELSVPLAKTLKATFNQDDVVVIQGDSRHVVPVLAQFISHSVFWFFDANWWQRKPELDPGIAGDRDSYPLWDELRGVVERPFRDVIVVNEVSTFGALSAAGRDRRTVTVEAITNLYPKAEVVVLGDVLAVYR